MINYLFVVISFLFFFYLLTKSDKYDLNKKDFSIVLISSSFLGLVFLMKNKQTSMFLISSFLIIIMLLCFVFVVDFKFQEIPNLYVLGITILSITYVYHTKYISFETFDFYTIISSGIVYSLSFGVLMIITSGALGAGDVKLAFPIGILLTNEQFFNYIGYTFITGAIVGILFVLLKKKNRKDMIAFGPFMILSFFICVLS